MKRSYTVLVTGGAGFIGSHVVDACIKAGMRVHVIDDLSTGRQDQLHPEAVFHKLSITSPKLIPLIKRIQPDGVVHAAAKADVRASVVHPSKDAQVNVLGTVQVIQGACEAGARRFVFLSTAGVYPAHAKPPFDESSAIDPISPYAVAKRAGEMYLHAAEINNGLSYAVLRLANVYGPRQSVSKETGVIATFTRELSAGRGVTITGDGTQTRDFIYVDDVVKALLKALKAAPSGIYTIGTGKQTTINQLFEHIRSITGANVPEVHTPEKQGEVPFSSLRSTKAKKVFHWSPSTTLKEGLKKTVAWEKKRR